MNTEKVEQCVDEIETVEVIEAVEILRSIKFILMTSESSRFLNSGILLPKLFWPTRRKNCSSDREKLLKYEAEGWEVAKFSIILVWGMFHKFSADVSWG